jgi:uncharacterized lipoprotein YbaY
MTANRPMIALAAAALALAGCATAPPSAPTPAQTKQLAQLQKAYDSGVITRDQFEAQKKKILGAR